MRPAARVIDTAIRGERPVDSEFVEAMCDGFGLSTVEARTVTRAVLRARNTVADGYEIRTGAWRLDLTAAAAKAVACGTVTTVVLRGLGAESIPATVLSIIAPLLFELDRIEVGADDLVVHAFLVEAARGETVHLGELYERLPNDVRDELSLREFAGIVERLRDARLLVVGPDGVELRAGEANRRFRLHLR